MKSTLRTIIVSASLALFGLTAVTYTSCTEDKCKGIICAYGGTCNEGRCTCPTGYEGPQCETINRVRFQGDWYVNEDGTQSNAAQYTVSIEPDGDATHIKMTNFYNHLLQDVKATVLGDTLTIPQQVINNFTVEGWGVIVDDLHYGEHGRIELYYYVTDGNTGSTDRYGIGGGSSSKWNK